MNKLLMSAGALCVLAACGVTASETRTAEGQPPTPGVEHVVGAALLAELGPDEGLLLELIDGVSYRFEDRAVVERVVVQLEDGRTVAGQDLLGDRPAPLLLRRAAPACSDPVPPTYCDKDACVYGCARQFGIELCVNACQCGAGRRGSGCDRYYQPPRCAYRDVLHDGFGGGDPAPDHEASGAPGGAGAPPLPGQPPVGGPAGGLGGDGDEGAVGGLGGGGESGGYGGTGDGQGGGGGSSGGRSGGSSGGGSSSGGGRSGGSSGGRSGGGNPAAGGGGSWGGGGW
jgi:hypothetical protein